MVLIMSSGQGLALDFIRVIVRVTSRGTVCSMIKRLTGIWQLGYPVRKFEGPVGIGLMHRVLKEGRACSCVELRDWGWFLFEFFDVTPGALLIFEVVGNSSTILFQSHLKLTSRTLNIIYITGVVSFRMSQIFSELGCCRGIYTFAFVT